MRTLLVLILLWSGLQAEFIKQDEAVKDTERGLLWQDNSAVESEELLFREANDYCQNLVLEKHDDWRLPTLLELQSIIDYKRYDPALERGFHFGLSKNYWTSTLYADDKERAWDVNFKSGNSEHNRHSYDFYVRCVRSGK